MKQTDVIVIGAGIAGLSAAIYLKRSSLSSILLEKSAPGGTLLNVHKIDNYPGFETIPGPELAEKVFSQAMALGVQYEYGNVVSVNKEGDIFEVKTDVETYQAKAVIVAAGIQIQQTGFPGQKEYLGKGISYCATCDGNFYRNKPVAVIGHENRAAEEAIYLAGLVSSLDFISQEGLEIEERLLDQLKANPKVRFHLGAKVLKVEGEKKLDSITILEGGEEKKLPVDGVFPLFGERSSAEFLSPFGVSNERGYLNVDVSRGTAVPGLFAAGDVINKTLRQAVTAASDGAEAATSAIRYVGLLKKMSSKSK